MSQFSEIAKLIYYVRIYLDRNYPNSPKLFSDDGCVREQYKKLREALQEETHLPQDEKDMVLRIFNKVQKWLHSDFEAVVGDKPVLGTVYQLNTDTGKYSLVKDLPIEGNQFGWNLQQTFADDGLDMVVALETMSKLLKGANEG